jgi:hypothetical protein
MDAVRIAVMIQMLLNIAVVGAFIRLTVGAARRLFDPGTTPDLDP